MNERNLKRTLSMSIVEALRAQGHILVVKGGATALARELEEMMAPLLAQITSKIQPYPVVGGEVTSTFGHESIDETVEVMVANLTRALMDSDHVEDVFAEDNVIRRDIFRTVREGLLKPSASDAPGDDDPSIRVELDTLGYVAATVSKIADPKTLREALGRAAEVAVAHFTAYHQEARAATFVLQDDDPDGRLELEEAIADELTDLVEEGKVELPTKERRLDLGRALTPAEQRAARPRIEVALQKALRGTGCSGAWELEGGRTLRVILTPLSDQDAQNVDQYVGVFARELEGVRELFGGPPAPSAEPEPRGRRAPLPETTSRRSDPDDDELDDGEDEHEEDEHEEDEHEHEHERDDEDDRDLEDEDEHEDEEEEEGEDEHEDEESARDERRTPRTPSAEKTASRPGSSRGKLAPSPRDTKPMRSEPKRDAPKRPAKAEAPPHRASKAATSPEKKPAAPKKAGGSAKTSTSSKRAAVASDKPRKVPAKKR